MAGVRLKAESVRVGSDGEPVAGARMPVVPDGTVHALGADDEPMCGATVTPLYLVEWEWNELNDLLRCPDCATLMQSGL
jgi:hypothetical protein